MITFTRSCRHWWNCSSSNCAFFHKADQSQCEVVLNAKLCFKKLLMLLMWQPSKPQTSALLFTESTDSVPPHSSTPPEKSMIGGVVLSECLGTIGVPQCCTFLIGQKLHSILHTRHFWKTHSTFKIQPLGFWYVSRLPCLIFQDLWSCCRNANQCSPEDFYTRNGSWEGKVPGTFGVWQHLSTIFNQDQHLLQALWAAET